MLSGGWLSVPEGNIQALIYGKSSTWKFAPNRALASLNSSVGSIISAFGDEIRRKNLSPEKQYTRRLRQKLLFDLKFLRRYKVPVFQDTVEHVGAFGTPRCQLHIRLLLQHF